MDVNHLGSEELRYELYIRGLPLSGTFAQKRTELRNALRLEKEDQTMPPSSSTYDVDSELCLCRSKLITIERDINTQNLNTEFRKLNTLLMHVSLRVNRIHVAAEIDQILKDTLLSQCAKLIGQLNLESQGIITPKHGTALSSYPFQNQASVVSGKAFRPNEAAVSNDLITLDDEPPNESTQEDGNDEEQEAAETNSQASEHNVPVEDHRSFNLRHPSAMPNFFAVPQELSHIYNPLNPPQLFNRWNPLGEGAIPTRISHSGLLPQPIDQFPEHRYIVTSSCTNPQISTRTSTSAQESRAASIEYLKSNNSNNRPSQETFVFPSGQSTANNSLRRDAGRTNQHFSSDGNLRSLNPELEQLSGRVRFDPKISCQPERRTNDNDHSKSIPLADLINDLEFSPLRQSYRQPPYADVSRWNLKYNGQSSVNDFLERVEELRRSRGISKEQLLRSCPELFAGDALLWYRTCNFSDWDDLVRQLRESFQPYDYEFALWDEIRRRTQGAQERVLNYVVAMENLFRKLSEVPPELTKLNIIRRNLLPFIQSRLATYEVSNIQHLIRLCRAVEETESRVQRFVPPPTNVRQLLEPELAYKKPSYHAAVLDVNSERMSSGFSDDPRADLLIDAINSNRTLTCWNCEGSGHGFRQCQHSKTVFCYKCGKKEVTTKTCPRCSKNLSLARN